MAADIVRLQLRVHQLETVVEAASENQRRLEQKIAQAERENDVLKARVAALESQLKMLGAEVPDGEVQIH